MYIETGLDRRLKFTSLHRSRTLESDKSIKMRCDAKSGQQIRRAEGFMSPSKNTPFQVVHIKTMYTHEVGELQEQEANSKNG